jgi:hypothetical protein
MVITNKIYYMHILCYSYVSDPGLPINKPRSLQFVAVKEKQEIYIHSCKTGKDTSRTARMSEELLRNQIWDKLVTVKQSILHIIHLYI